MTRKFVKRSIFFPAHRRWCRSGPLFPAPPSHPHPLLPQPQSTALRLRHCSALLFHSLCDSSASSTAPRPAPGAALPRGAGQPSPAAPTRRIVTPSPAGAAQPGSGPAADRDQWLCPSRERGWGGGWGSRDPAATLRPRSPDSCRPPGTASASSRALGPYPALRLHPAPIPRPAPRPRRSAPWQSAQRPAGIWGERQHQQERPRPHSAPHRHHLVEGGLGHRVVLDGAAPAVRCQHAEHVRQGAGVGRQAVLQRAAVLLLQRDAGEAALHQMLHSAQRGAGPHRPHHHCVPIPKPAPRKGRQCRQRLSPAQPPPPPPPVGPPPPITGS